MQLLGAVIVIELLGVFLAGSGFSFPHAALNARTQTPQLAQVDSAVPPSPDIPPSTPESPPPPSQEGTILPQDQAPGPSGLPQELTPEQTPSPKSVPPETPGTTAEPTAPSPEGQPAQEPQIPQQEEGATQPPSESSQPSGLQQPESITSNPDQKNTGEATESAPPVAQDIVAPTENITDVSHIDAELITKTNIEDAQIAGAETPEEKTNLLVNFANESVDDVDASLQKNSFSGVNFLTQRLDDQINQVATLIGEALPEEQDALKEKVRTFSEQADRDLRNQQLVVPESLEQDMEITRGKLLLLQ